MCLSTSKRSSRIDFANGQWAGDFDPGRITEFWHANKFISSTDSSLYSMGGYGFLRYKNLVQRYSFATKKWELIATSGNHSPPRYLAALGKGKDPRFVYILGGYGSLSVDQMLDPQNFYVRCSVTISGNARSSAFFD